MPNGLCNFCRGYGGCMTIQNGKMDWRACPFCEGHGTRNAERGEKLIHSHAR